MDGGKMIEPMVENVLDDLIRGKVTAGMYGVVNKHLETFTKMEITPDDIRKVLELKKKIVFLPEPFAYSLSRPGRGDYLLANFDSPSVVPLDRNEERFVAALHSYYQEAATYKKELKILSQKAERSLKWMSEYRHYQLGEEQESELLTEILMKRDIDRYSYHTDKEQKQFLEKFDLYDAYHMDDDKQTLRWQAGEILESRGLVPRGSVERILTEEHVSIDELKNRLTRHQIDKRRVDWVEVVDDKICGTKYIRCRVDGEYRHVRRLSVKDAELLEKLENKKEMAVKYFTDVLEKNWGECRMMVDEKAFVRMSMSYTDRLIDIYRHGMNEQEVMLSKASKDSFVDRFWWATPLFSLEQHSVEDQKKYAFKTLVYYIEDLRPGQMTKEEMIELVGMKGQTFTDEGRELEDNIMNLPTSFFPLIEQCGKYDREMIDYVKVQRGIGIITPTIAYNSMHYFLSHRLYTEWDPEGTEVGNGETTGEYYYPNRNMSNPAEKFPSNLLNELQWSTLGNKSLGEAAKFIPDAAYPKNLITGVQVYPSGNGGLYIRGMVDGEQQGGKLLSEEDAIRCKDERTDLHEMALGYFTEAFAWKGEKNVSLKR